MQYLLAIQIGPVQEFIATARKSRYLWFGSWLLSELAKAAARTLVAQNGKESLIFPSILDEGDLQAGSEFNVVNKIVALVQQEPDKLSQQIYNAMLAHLHQIRDEAYGTIKGHHFCRQQADEHVDDLIEYYWAAVRFDDETNEQAYGKARQAVDALLAARKTTRDFRPVTWGSNAPKSSLDGLRESVIHEEAYPSRQAKREERKKIARTLDQNYGVKEGERLCGIGLLKRHGRRNTNPQAQESFFSTSHVAVLPLLARIKANDASAIESYVNVLRNECGVRAEDINRIARAAYPPFQYDGHLLFAERLPDLVGEEESQTTIAQEALKRFL